MPSRAESGPNIGWVARICIVAGSRCSMTRAAMPLIEQVSITSVSGRRWGAMRSTTSSKAEMATHSITTGQCNTCRSGNHAHAGRRTMEAARVRAHRKVARQLGGPEHPETSQAVNAYLHTSDHTKRRAPVATSGAARYDGPAMRIAIIGYGRMGRETERLATAAGHEIAARIDPHVAKMPTPRR